MYDLKDETHEARVEYAEPVRKLRAQFDEDLAAALAFYRDAVKPAQVAFNTAVISAENAWRASLEGEDHGRQR